MEKYNEIIKRQAEKLGPGLLSKNKLNCEQLQFGAEAPLYLGKPHWTNRFDPERDSTIGIFYAIWVSPKLIEEGQYAYNIHSKNIRKLPGYKLTSIKFAKEFRSLVETRVSNWPGIRLDHGPTTLLQGFDTLSLDSFAEKIEDRITDFVSIHTEIDKLLDASAV